MSLVTVISSESLVLKVRAWVVRFLLVAIIILIVLVLAPKILVRSLLASMLLPLISLISLTLPLVTLIVIRLVLTTVLPSRMIILEAKSVPMRKSAVNPKNSLNHAHHGLTSEVPPIDLVYLPLLDNLGRKPCIL